MRLIQNMFIQRKGINLTIMNKLISDIKNLIDTANKELKIDSRFNYHSVSLENGESVKIDISSKRVRDRVIDKMRDFRIESGDSERIILRALSGTEIAFNCIGRREDMLLSVRTAVADIRNTPSHRGELITQAIMGEELKGLTREGDWYLVQLPDRYIGWVCSWSVMRVSRCDIQDWNCSVNGMVVENRAVVYSEAGSGESRIGELVSGTFIRLGRVKNGFYSVTLSDGRKGFIVASDIGDLPAGVVNPGRLIGRAGRFIGVSYLWGGTTSMGFDCSGLIKRVFQMEGIALPRDSDLQFEISEETDFSEAAHAAPGSLFFFHKEGVVSHVALSTGAGRFIHSRGEVSAGSLIESDENYDKELAESFCSVRGIISE